jgi:hypothetical protein
LIGKPPTYGMGQRVIAVEHSKKADVSLNETTGWEPNVSAWLIKEPRAFRVDRPSLKCSLERKIDIFVYESIFQLLELQQIVGDFQEVRICVCQLLGKGSRPCVRRDPEYTLLFQIPYHESSLLRHEAYEFPK